MKGNAEVGRANGLRWDLHGRIPRPEDAVPAYKMRLPFYKQCTSSR